MKSSSPPGLFACNWMGKPTKEVWIILPLYPDPGLGARSCSPSDRTCDAAATGRFFSACTRCCRGFALFSSKFLATIRKLILDSKTLLQKTHHLVIKPCSWFASPSSLIPADDKPLFTNRFTCRYLSLYPCFLYSAVVPIFIHCCCVTSSWWPMSLHFFWWTPKNPTFGWGPVLSSFGLQRFTLFGRETFVVALLGASEWFGGKALVEENLKWVCLK